MCYDYNHFCDVFSYHASLKSTHGFLAESTEITKLYNKIFHSKFLTNQDNLFLEEVCALLVYIH